MEGFKMEKIKILQLQRMVRQVGNHRFGVKILHCLATYLIKKKEIKTEVVNLGLKTPLPL